MKKNHCPACAGNGVDFNEGDPCHECGGTGVRPILTWEDKAVDFAFLKNAKVTWPNLDPGPLPADPKKPHAVYVDGYGYVDVKAVRAVERAHKIGTP